MKDCAGNVTQDSMQSDRFYDPQSIAGHGPQAAETCDLLIIGGGEAGLAAAVLAAQAGRGVVLVDEHPVPLETMGEEVPLYFGQSMTSAVRNRTAMTEAILAADPGFEAAFEAGVDIRLGTACWGLFPQGPGAAWGPRLAAGLMEPGRAWLIAPQAVILATGRRDMGLAFPGWQRPGICGITAARQLAERYGAFAPQAVAVLGSSAETLEAALALQACGVRIAAVVEVAEEIQGPAALADRLAGSGTLIRTGHAPRQAHGAGNVEGLTIAALPQGGPGAAAPERIACDGIVIGIGAVPVIDLLSQAGARIAFDETRGGFVPVLGAEQRTSLPDVYAIGDCAGIWPAKSLAPAVTQEEAAAAVAAILGAEARAAPSPAPGFASVAAYRAGWLQAVLRDATEDCQICQCEEVTAREILALQPPRYLGQAERDAPPAGAAETNPDVVKRLTRAGMGACQGRRCREQIASLLALAGGQELSAVPLAGYRAPVRPLPLALAGQLPEDPAQAAHWDSWFGMRGQWQHFADVPAEFTVAGTMARGVAVSE